MKAKRILILSAILFFYVNAFAQNYLDRLCGKVNYVTIDGKMYVQRDFSRYIDFVNGKTSKQTQDAKDAQTWLYYLNRPHPSVQVIEEYMKRASDEFDVPYELLAAIAYVETNWTQIGPSIDRRWGIMALSENNYSNTLSEAAALIGQSEEKLRDDAEQNIRGAAALLHKIASQQQKYPRNINDWFIVVEEYTGHIDAATRELGAKEYFDVLANGIDNISLWNERIIIKANKNVNINGFLKYDLALKKKNNKKLTDWYPDAIVDETQNQSSRNGTTIDVWVNHWIGEGTLAGAISWFKNPDSQVSAHFLIDHDGTITQMVAISKKAWHARSYNSRSIGIEHYATAVHPEYWQKEDMLHGSAKVARYYCDELNIPMVHRVKVYDPGIYGHKDIPGASTDCPGPLPWDKWLSYLRDGRYVVRPVLYEVAYLGGEKIRITWKAPDTVGIKGFRLYFAEDNDTSVWKLGLDELSLTKEMTTITLNGFDNFVNKPLSSTLYFKMTTVNDSVESNFSDTYGLYINSSAGSRALIVDGFDRTTGSYNGISNSFSVSYVRAIASNTGISASSCANDAIIDSVVDLGDYDYVIWFLGDESTASETFSYDEQNIVSSYLEKGGNLLVSGSEIAWDLDEKGDDTDRVFLNTYLKVAFESDGTTGLSPAQGVSGSYFEGLSLNFGQVYEEDYPDSYIPSYLAVPVLKYSNGAVAAVAYKGEFYYGAGNSAVLIAGFPLETCAKQEEINDFINRFFDFAKNAQNTDNYCKPGSSDAKKLWTVSFKINDNQYLINNKKGYNNNIYSTSTVTTKDGIKIALKTGHTADIENASCVIFIDYNQDGIFDVDNELFVKSQFGTSEEQSFEGFIPSDAKAGKTIMRVFLAPYGFSADNACDNIEYGQVNDYLINILNNGSPELSSDDMKIYPNPAKDYVVLPGINSAEKILIIDSYGKTVKVIENYDGRINVSDLAIGYYLVEIINGTTIAKSKFMIIR